MAGIDITGLGPYGTEVQAIDTQTTHYINERFSSAVTHAEEAYQRAMALLNAMAGLVLNLRTFDANIVLEVGDINAPDPNIARPTKPDTISTLLTATQDKLRSIIQNGGTGLPPTIEDSIFQREYERSQVAKFDAKTKVADDFARRGYRLPPAMMAAQLTEIENQYMMKRMDVSRDIGIKQAEMQINQLDEALKQAATEEVSRIDNIIKMYSADTTLYTADVDAYRALIDKDIKVIQARMELVVQQATISLKNAEINMKSYDTLTVSQLEAMKAMGQITAQLVAGSLSGISTSAHISAAGSASISANASSSTSVSDVTEHTSKAPVPDPVGHN
jgi:hypothetical protein